MKKFTQAAAMLCALAVLCSAFSSCGSKPSEDTTAPESTVADEIETFTMGEPSVAVEDKILTVGTSIGSSTLEYADKDGNPLGFDIALISLVGQKLGADVVIENIEKDKLLSGVGETIDVAISAIAPTSELKETVDFSESYYVSTKCIIISADNTELKSTDNLKEKTVGAQKGSSCETTARDISGAAVETFDSVANAVDALLAKKVDAIVVDSTPSKTIIEKNADKLKLMENVSFDEEAYSIALPKGDLALRYAVNEALSAIKESGEFDSILQQYFY